MADKPRTRGGAEDRAANLQRYEPGDFGPNATQTLGIRVVYPQDAPQGVTVSSFLTDSTAEAGGLEQFDWILEVDNSPVGFIRGRHYEPWEKYGRSGPNRTEVLVSFTLSDGTFRYYYPRLTTATVTESYRGLPPDFFTVAKPRDRQNAEGREQNLARYVLSPANFGTYSPLELGVMVQYSATFGATILGLKPGGAAQGAGLRVGDHIMEVDGAPVGEFGPRTYELWRQ